MNKKGSKCLILWIVISFPAFGQSMDVTQIVAGSNAPLVYNEVESGVYNILIKSVFGVTVLEKIAKEQKLTLHLPKILGRQSGNLFLEVRNKSNTTAIYDTVLVLPDTSATAKLEAYLGPTRVEASKENFTAIVAFLLDPFDNLWTGDQKIDVTVSRPIDQEKYRSDGAKPLIYQQFPTSIHSGKGFLDINTPHAGSVTRSFSVYPSEPEYCSISFDRKPKIAGDRSDIVISSSIIKDSFGNTVAEGTSLKLKIKQKENVTDIPVLVVNGRVSIAFPTPKEPGKLILTLFSRGKKLSNTLHLDLKSVDQN
jgi:hypothetical protein